MVLPNYIRSGAQIIGLVGLTSLFICADVYAQDGPPLPGSQYSAAPASYAGAPGVPGKGAPAPSGYSAPIPGTPRSAGGPVAPGLGLVPGTSASAYGRLPLNPGMAQARLEELRNLMPNSRPKEFQDSISSYCDWLSDMADAHWRIYQAFAKVDSARAQAESERQLCLRFGALKRQAMLLKAEFLIQQHRYPEALGPLVDIVAAEPRTETGQSAYQLLQSIGFSDVVQPAALTPKTTEASPVAATSPPASASKAQQIPPR